MSRSLPRRALRRAPTAALLLVAASPAFAQDAAPATELAPVEATATAWRSWMPVQGFVAPTTTTGTKTDTPLIEAPQSVGVVTRDQIQAQASRTVSQALRFTAGDGWRYGFLGLPLAFVALPLYVLLPNHYAREFGVPLAALGTLLLAVRLLDAVMDPWLGRI